MKCQYCGNVQEIENSLEIPTEHDFDLSDTDDNDINLTDWGFEQQTIHCEKCGGESIIPELETATTCVFCGSPKVLAQVDKTSIRPETIISFRMSLDEALTSFRSWKKKRWFVPNAFKKGELVSHLKGIYIPYWTFDSMTSSSYSAERGDYHYRNETRTRVVDGKTETYTERVRYTVWHWVNGHYDDTFDDILVPASRRYDKGLLKKIGKFDLNQLKEYKPEYLSGFIAERYSVTRQDGWLTASEKIDNSIYGSIKGVIGGDEVRGLTVETNYYNRTYKHLLVPIWNANYIYRGKNFRYMVNGQTGLVSGEAPRSPWKITIFVLFCLIVIAIPLYFYTR
ncbi:hypothetical protein J2T13_000037 [Paenibacillus sp. DS2015]